uniref:Oxysterol-binding protein n=1 Tax=Bactrocera dorsalis TaxID=27457 RepID=A0A034V755_BACDO
MSDMLLNKPTPERSAAGSKDPEMKGWLMKWTNYIKGYQRRWFVLSRGVLSYYRSQAEMNHTCRGTISLHGALIHTVDSCTFVISNGGTQTFHIKAANEVERQSWVTALELAKAKAIRTMETEEEEEVETSHVVPSQEINTVMAELTGRLESLRTCYDLITKHGIALQRALSELESNDEESLASRTKIVNERATLFRITCNAMINACNDYLRSAESQGHKWSKMVEHEREQRQRLEEMVEMLAKQQTRLEQAAHTAAQHNKPLAIANESAASPNAVTSDDENEFFDAEENNGVFGENSPNEASGFVMTLPSKSSTHKGEDVEDGSFVMKLQKTRSNSEEQTHHSSSSENEELKLTESEPQQVVVISKKNSIISQKSISKHNNGNQQNQKVAQLPKTNRQRRTRVPDKPNHPLNLWSVMKNCIGKELSKIPMPVNFNEPLSMLQRLTEDYEYADLLDAAARCTDECEQLAYVAAFTITSYATTTNRTGKPFNPLLGETFECDRMDDLGWRVLAEQVSHHPPVSAFYVTNRQDGFCISCSILAKSKFYGNSTSAVLEGVATLTLLPRGETYTLNTPYAHCKGILVGTLSMELGGKVNIECENTGYKTELEFKLKPFLGGSDYTNLISGKIKLGKETMATISGHWDTEMTIKEAKTGEETVLFKADADTKHKRLVRYVVPLDAQLPNESERLWEKVSLAIRSDDQVGATEEKTVLEEAQRNSAKERKALSIEWMPVHFNFDPIITQWMYNYADLRPWDQRNDLKQYEANYKVLTKTRHRAPMVKHKSLSILGLPHDDEKSDSSGSNPDVNKEPHQKSNKSIRKLVSAIEKMNHTLEEQTKQLRVIQTNLERIHYNPRLMAPSTSTGRYADIVPRTVPQTVVIKSMVYAFVGLAACFVMKWMFK